MTRYEQGFMNKCAEYGVPVEMAIGMMQKVSEPQETDIGHAIRGGLDSAVGFGGLAGTGHAILAAPRLDKELSLLEGLPRVTALPLARKTLKNFGKKVGKTALIGGGVVGLLRFMSELARNSKKSK